VEANATIARAERRERIAAHEEGKYDESGMCRRKCRPAGEYNVAGS
jgi:hypothetical protein